MPKRLPIALLLVALVIGFRLLGALRPDWLPNFQPLAAMFFCGAACLRTRAGVLVPLAAWLISFPLVNLLLGHPDDTSGLFVALAGFASVAAIGKAFQGRGTKALIAGTLAASVAFYLVTNVACFLSDPLYTKDLQGFTQALWSGPAGFAQPTWVFFRNALAADLVFTGLFLLASAGQRAGALERLVARRVS